MRRSFVTQFLSAIDLVLVWWVVTLSIGLAVLYKRRTGGIMITLLCMRVVHSSSATPGRVPKETRCPGKGFHHCWDCAGSRRGCGGQPVSSPRDGPERERRGPPVARLGGHRLGIQQIQPKRQVGVSANTTGRVTRVAVEEGQRVKTGQFLLEIDPRSLDAQLQRGEASVAAAQSSLQQARAAVQQTRVALDLARQNLKRTQELWKEGLTTRESLERAENDVQAREAELKTREQEIQTNEQRIGVRKPGSPTKVRLNQIIISAPMDGLVTQRSIERARPLCSSR